MKNVQKRTFSLKDALRVDMVSSIIKKYGAVVERLPDKGINLQELTKAIIIEIGVVTDTIIKRHIQVMEMLGFILKEEKNGNIVWKPKYIHEGDFEPLKENDIEAEIDELLDNILEDSGAD